MIFEKHFWKLFGINMDYPFIGLMIIVGILAVWV
jgi:hypothetical protein|tara:strand:- start:702 stop:803 length:102 start_codon:yes stop_codon:yes gene_type:complete